MKALGRLIINLIGMMFTAGLVGMVAAGVVLYHYSLDLPDLAELETYNPATVTRLYAADGKLLAEYSVEERVYVPLTAVPKRVIQAFISAEDKNFYTNSGIDPYGIFRAVLQNWRHLTGSGGRNSLVGGSTITQQVVKNFLLTPEKSLSRKIKEAILAFRITQVYTKDRILELYLNEIYLGRGSYGVAQAAVNYFNKSLDELTVEEAAFLAAMPQAPARSDPALHYDRAKERRDWVINRMMDNGFITADEARASIADPIAMHARDRTETANADFFAEEVRRELAARYGTDALYKGGLFVKTTLDPELQSYADESLRFALMEYDHRRGYRGAISHFDQLIEWAHQLTELEAKRRWPLFDGERLAVVLDATKAHISIGFSDGKKAVLDKTSVEWMAHKEVLAGDIIIAAPSADKAATYATHQIPLVNGAMIVMDPHNGKVLAMSGGYSYGGTEFNRATQAHRQPGSSFKPFVYLTAMENGFTPASIVEDGPVELSQGDGMPIWKPANYHGDYLGPSTLRTGIEKSRNAMTVRLASMLGIDKIIEMALRFGIYEKLPPQFSIVLGAQETTLIRLANAYCMLANGGKKVSPWLIERIDDHNGKTILRRDTRDCKGCKIDVNATSVSPLPPVIPDDRPQIVDPRSNYQVVYMLQGVVERGTAARAHKIGKTLAGKTGTTNDSRDTWFMGFSPDLVAGIYVGYDQPQSLGTRETGASVALPGFIHFMERALKDKPSVDFNVPPGISFVKINQKTGLVPGPGDTDPTIMEAFKDEQSPLNKAPENIFAPVDNLPPGTPPVPGQVVPPAGTAAPQPLPWQRTAPTYSFPAENPAPVEVPKESPAENPQVTPPAADAPGMWQPDEEVQPHTLPPSRYENRPNPQ